MKTNLLVLNASSRLTGSITRTLTQRFAATWERAHPGATVVQRDLIRTPPQPIDEVWIDAAFSPAGLRAEPQQAALALSEALIEELTAADVIVLGAPIYNFGLPGILKVYFDQIVRIGRTFAFNPKATEPYTPLLPNKPVIVVVSASDRSMYTGGSLAHLNFLEPHLATLLGFVGLRDVTFVRVVEHGASDPDNPHGLAHAETNLDKLVARHS